MLPDEETEKQERRILTSSESQTLKQALAVADDIGWLNQNLWAGLVPFYGSSAMTLVGSPEELAAAFLAYKEIGITQFIISGWPKLEEMMIFGREVIPLVVHKKAHNAQ
jgi:alkanesulfonate monooxygenase